MISIADQIQAVARAEAALAHLEAHPRASLARLGAARDQLNLVRNLTNTHDVYDAVAGIETSVIDLYGHNPDNPSSTPPSTDDATNNPENTDDHH